MKTRRPLRLVAVLVGLLAASGARAQIARVELVERGRPVPVDVTDELALLGRTVARGLLATARRDVTRPISDGEVASLGRRGTLLRIRLTRPEPVHLLRLGARARPSRLAAYVPPGRDDHAFVFLGRSTSWNRIVVVDLPERIRREVRRLRATPGPPAR